MARNRSKKVQEYVPEQAKLKQKALEMPLQLEHLQLKQPAQVSKGLRGGKRGTGADASFQVF